MWRKGEEIAVSEHSFFLNHLNISPPRPPPFAVFPDCFCWFYFIQQSPIFHYLLFIQLIFLKFNNMQRPGRGDVAHFLVSFCPARG